MAEVSHHRRPGSALTNPRQPAGLTGPSQGATAPFQRVRAQQLRRQIAARLALVAKLRRGWFSAENRASAAVFRGKPVQTPSSDGVCGYRDHPALPWLGARGLFGADEFSAENSSSCCMVVRVSPRRFHLTEVTSQAPTLCGPIPALPRRI